MGHAPCPPRPPRGPRPAPDSPQPAAPQGRAAGSLAEREKPCCSRHDPHWPCAPSTWTEYLDRDTVCGGPARASGAQRAMPRSLPATTRSCLRGPAGRSRGVRCPEVTATGPPCSWPLMRPVWPLECNQTASPAGCAVTSAPSSAPNLAPEDAGESSVLSTRHPERGAHARGSSAVNRRLSAVSVCLSPEFPEPLLHACRPPCRREPEAAAARPPRLAWNPGRRRPGGCRVGIVGASDSVRLLLRLSAPPPPPSLAGSSDVWPLRPRGFWEKHARLRAAATRPGPPERGGCRVGPQSSHS